MLRVDVKLGRDRASALVGVVEGIHLGVGIHAICSGKYFRR